MRRNQLHENLGDRPRVSGRGGLVALLLLTAMVPAMRAQGVKDGFANEVSALPRDRFAIEIGGKVRGFFTQCSGLGSETEVREFRAVDGRVIEKAAGRVSTGDTVCRRKVGTDTYFWDWRLVVEQGMINFRRSAAIILFDERNVEVARWELTDAWPSRMFVATTKDTAGFAEEAVVLTSMTAHRVR